MALDALNQRTVFKQLPLRLILIVPFVLQIFVAVGLTGYLAILNGQKSVNKTASQLRSEISNRINQQIFTYLEQPSIINQVIATGIAEQNISVANIPMLERFYWRLVSQNTVDFVQTATSTGASVLIERLGEGFIVARIKQADQPDRQSYRLDEQGRQIELLATQEFDPHTRPWYTAALQAGQPTWSEVFLGIETSQAIISLSQPIYSETGELLGVQSSNFRLSRIHEFLQSVAVGQSGQTFIVDRAGNLIASSTVEQPYKVQDNSLELIQAKDAGNSVIQTTAKSLFDQFGSFDQIHQTQQLEVQINGDRHFVQLSPIQDGNGIDWFSIVVIPESDFMAEINANTRTTILLCLSALATATILGIYTSKWIAQPILRLSQASEAIADGAFDQNIESINVRELEILAQSFNRMIQQLRETFTALEQTNEQLEERVEERTEELSNAMQELQRTQVQMIQAEKMSSLGQLVAGVAHEINNPVNFIYGNMVHVSQYSQDLLELVQLYQREFPTPTSAIQEKVDDIDLEFLTEDMLKLLASMKIGTERIQEIVKSLRTFSRLDEAQVKEVDVHEGLDSTLLILQHRLKANGTRPELVVVRDYGKLPPVECYPGQLNQVFMNILVNAIDALDEKVKTAGLRSTTNGGQESDTKHADQAIKDELNQITIRTSVVDAEWVEISIADNGSGIPEEIQQQIFNPFFTTKPVGKGTGMGMSISHQIITAKHGGKLDYFSTLGAGTEFIIQIPIRLKSPDKVGV